MIRIAGKSVGSGHPVFVIAEVGQNHQGDIEHARRLIHAAAEAGADAVKFQRRTLEVCVPPEQRDEMRDTPWGRMRYIDYRRRLEFESYEQWNALIAEAEAHGIAWLASSWDDVAAAFIDALDPPAHKIASASITDHNLLRYLGSTGRPLIMSTGMSTTAQVIAAMHAIREGYGHDVYPPGIALLHCNSSYPCEPRDVNLAAMANLRGLGADCIGYSGHERGIQISVAAVALGASIIERHITLDRTQWGTDHAASLEPKGFAQLVRDIRIVEEAMGDGVKRVTDSELPVMKKLRRTA